MSLFQCGVCGCCENTALAMQGCDGYAEKFFDWTGFEDRRGKKLCSACAPTKYSGGKPSGLGKWHGQFERTFLPMGQFRTAQNGNLEHIKTGSHDFRQFAIPPFDSTQPCDLERMSRGEKFGWGGVPTVCMRCHNPHHKCDRGTPV